MQLSQALSLNDIYETRSMLKDYFQSVIDSNEKEYIDLVLYFAEYENLDHSYDYLMLFVDALLEVSQRAEDILEIL
jgi:hypothetical protein